MQVKTVVLKSVIKEGLTEKTPEQSCEDIWRKMDSCVQIDQESKYCVNETS